MSLTFSGRAYNLQVKRRLIKVNSFLYHVCFFWQIKLSIIDSSVQIMNNRSKILKKQHYSHINVLHKYITTRSSPHSSETGRLFFLWAGQEIPRSQAVCEWGIGFPGIGFPRPSCFFNSKEMELPSAAVVTFGFVVCFLPRWPSREQTSS